eukprot:jgi/Antlo1/20/45
MENVHRVALRTCTTRGDTYYETGRAYARSTSREWARTIRTFTGAVWVTCRTSSAESSRVVRDAETSLGDQRDTRRLGEKSMQKRETQCTRTRREAEESTEQQRESMW